MYLPHQVFPKVGSQDGLYRYGKSLRKRIPRGSHSELGLPANRDPLAITDATHVGRVPELIGVRTYRMSQSAFAYYRATADVMAADLATGVNSGIRLVICGDAHISNFGLYASPERRLIFDLNDFDEAGEGPWEWDLKRMCVSLVLVLREKKCSLKTQRQGVMQAVERYRLALAEMMGKSALERFYASVDAEWLLKATKDAQLAKSMKKARRNTSQRVLEKIAVRHDKQGYRIVDAPPILVHDRDLNVAHLDAMFDEYLSTLAADRALMIRQYHLVDMARRVVGVGSVGTRCGIALLQDAGGHTLFMQYKQANPSVLTRWGGMGEADRGDSPVALRLPEEDHAHQGRRVVSRQRILQSVSDPLLGWNVGADDGHDYYWRQFRDMKGSIDLNLLSPEQSVRYTALCARLLARAHAQSPTAAAVAGYLGGGGSFAEAVAKWCTDYADVIENDYSVFMDALKQGRYPYTPEEQA